MVMLISQKEYNKLSVKEVSPHAVNKSQTAHGTRTTCSLYWHMPSSVYNVLR